MQAAAEVQATWSVGELADDLGVTTRTLRFYEAEGLISPERSGVNRVYRQRDRARLRLILRGKRFGMSLAEIREIVDMYDGAATGEQRQLATLLGRLDEIAADLRARQADLRRTLAEVTDVAQRCRDRLAELGADAPTSTLRSAGLGRAEPVADRAANTRRPRSRRRAQGADRQPG